MIRRGIIAAALIFNAVLWQSCGRRTVESAHSEAASVAVNERSFRVLDSVTLDCGMVMAVDSPRLRVVRSDSCGMRLIEVTGRRAVVASRRSGGHRTVMAGTAADSVSASRSITSETKISERSRWSVARWLLAAAACCAAVSLLSYRGRRSRR